MIMDIEELISIHAKNGNKEIVDKLRDIQSRGIKEIKLNDKGFIDSDSDSDYESESDISDLESESSEEEYEVVKENIKVTLNKDGFYELI
tara:strand:- start:912 stop:1181 length:270 start_codon:yes stop_codon:yes gene_type:complete